MSYQSPFLNYQLQEQTSTDGLRIFSFIPTIIYIYLFFIITILILIYTVGITGIIEWIIGLGWSLIKSILSLIPGINLIPGI